MNKLLIDIPDIDTLGKVVRALSPLGVLGNATGVATTAQPAPTQPTATPGPAPAAPVDPWAQQPVAQQAQQQHLPWEQFIARAQAWTKQGTNANDFMGKLTEFGQANGVHLPNVPALQPLGPAKWGEFLRALPGA